MPQAVVEEYLTDAKAKTSMATYRARREKIPDTAQAHWQLAEWCEENGLQAEARAHFTAVVRLNPAREEAWKKLGYQKPKGRWMTADLAAAVKTEADHQRKADAHWRPLLEKWYGGLARKSKREDAEAALGRVRDPRAVPAIWRVFIVGGPADQERAVRLLSQIDSPAASRALASLAMMGSTEQIRGRSADALLKRDPREFVATLISVFRDPIEYEVREVLGPGKPGELYVHGERREQTLLLRGAAAAYDPEADGHGRFRRIRPSRGQPGCGLHARARGCRGQSALDGIARSIQRTAGAGQGNGGRRVWHSVRRWSRTSRLRAIWPI